MSEKELVLNVTINKIPYYCAKGHFVTNLTKNNFNARINQGLNPCAYCSVDNKLKKRIETISKALAKVNCKFISLKDRRLIYLCYCGRECKTWDNNVLLARGFTGCNNCTNPFNNPHIQKKIKQTCLEKYGVENVMHYPEIARKAYTAYKRKEYTFPSG